MTAPVAGLALDSESVKGSVERLTDAAAIDGSCPGWIVVKQSDLRIVLAQASAYKEALERINAECQVPKDLYDKNGPTWTGKDGHEYADMSYVIDKMTDLQAIVSEALLNGADR
ncbi:hypothetical protein KOAAANKH_02579 [Brevundimonas sp. NIBR10]|nr:hypothetical protein KOAAANKH_02579 [Brevundimonas sp. NIBR10]